MLLKCCSNYFVPNPGTRFIASREDDSSKPNNLIDDFLDFGFFKIQPNVLNRQETTNISLPRDICQKT